ncbi:ankyrin repeat-containing domain protein, partial [Bisporella sp. PMI_857]
RKQTLSFLLHRDGIDVNLADIEGLTPLLWAITSGNSEYVQMLLGHESIDVNQRDNIRRSPLLCALEIGAACGQGEKHTDFKEILRALLRAKDIDVNARDACEDTPFSWA